jgi:hypothetical protein
MRESGVANSSFAEEPCQQFNRRFAHLNGHDLDFARQALSRGKYDWPSRRMADCLNAMTVGVQHESAIIVGVIFGPQPWRTIVAPTSGKRRFVKGVYRLTIGSAEAEMRAGNWGFDLGFVGDRKFDTKRARRSTIIGAAALVEVDNAYEPERAQSGVIERRLRSELVTPTDT